MIPALCSSFLNQCRKKPSQALPKLPRQPASPAAQKETRTPGGLFFNLSPSVSKSIKYQVISLKRIAFCSTHFILSVWRAWYEKKKEENWVGQSWGKKGLVLASCLKEEQLIVLKSLFLSLFNLTWLAMSVSTSF